jgi:hypothetical protein
MATQTYKIVVDGVSEIIEADLIQYLGKTGQTLFYINEEIVTVAPANAFVLNVKDKVLSQKILDFLYENIIEKNKHQNSQIKGYIENGKTYDDIPVAIRQSSINAREIILEELGYFIEEQNQKK